MGRRRFTVAALTGDIDDLIGLDSIDQEHVHNADIDIGGNLLKTTNLALKEDTSTRMAVRDRADTTYRNLAVSWLQPRYGWESLISGNVDLHPYPNSTSSITFEAYDTAFRDCARLINGNFVLVPRTQPANHVEGAIFYNSADDTIYFSDGSTWHSLQADPRAWKFYPLAEQDTFTSGVYADVLPTTEDARIIYIMVYQASGASTTVTVRLTIDAQTITGSSTILDGETLYCYLDSNSDALLFTTTRTLANGDTDLRGQSVRVEAQFATAHVSDRGRVRYERWEAT